MNIIEQGRLPEDIPLWSGRCDYCGTVVECHVNECIFTSENKHIIKCPTPYCNNFISLSMGKWKKTVVDPKFERKDWYITPIKPEAEPKK